MILRKILIPALFAGILAAPTAGATSIETLHKFTGVADGLGVGNAFAVDPAGVLYGITSNGGNIDNVHCGDGCGTIFSVDPTSGKFATLHKFTEAEGVTLSGPLASGGGETFYGAAGFGGPGVSGGGGTIFKFDASNRTVSVLYTLTGANGAPTAPVTGVTLANGGLYGAVFLGGPGNFGGIYRFDLAAKTLKIVYAFNGSTGPKNAGYYMNTNMVVGTDGMVYGATSSGSTKGGGALFRINPTTHKLAVLHAVDDGNGGSMSGPLTVGPDGMLYGTTAQGSTAQHNCGGTGCGAVFKLDPTTLKLTILHSFTGGADGGFPEGVTALYSTGPFLYGVTGYGGTHKAGALYRINVTTGKLTVLQSFTGGAGGAITEYSFPALKFDKGKLFGVAPAGGYPAACNNQGCGTVFELAP